jgi:OCT family organic cation transporter-like MFS transporter 4/5
MFTGYSKDFWTYAILRFICTVALPCIWFSSHTLVIEIFTREHRKNAVLILGLVWPFSVLVVVMVFYFTQHWTYFHLWTGCICALAFPAFLLIPESPRWLIINSKRELAEQELLKIARWNRRNLSDDEKHKIASILQKIESTVNSDQEEKLGLKDMLNSRNLMKTIIMTLNWIITCVINFTLALNVTRISGNVFLNSVLLAILGDLPGKVLVGITLTLFSRRFNLFACQFLVGIFCIILAFLPKHNYFPLITFYLILMCFTNAAFPLVYLITGELYPTNLRSQAIGTCSTISRIFALSVPFIPKLSCTWKPLPMLVLGVPAICTAFLAYFLPETKNTKLPQTMRDAEDPKHVDT